MFLSSVLVEAMLMDISVLFKKIAATVWQLHRGDDDWCMHTELSGAQVVK